MLTRGKVVNAVYEDLNGGYYIDAIIKIEY